MNIVLPSCVISLSKRLFKWASPFYLRVLGKPISLSLPKLP